jgi:hypothetical protein
MKWSESAEIFVDLSECTSLTFQTSIRTDKSFSVKKTCYIKAFLFYSDIKHVQEID